MCIEYKKEIEVNMKKLIVLLCLLLGANCVYAEKIYQYRNTTPINSSDSVKVRGCHEHVSLPSRQNNSNVIESFFAGSSVATVLMAAAMDPYIIEIDGAKYVLVKDRKDGKWSEKDLLGFDDPKTNRFASLVKLNSDTDFSKVTSAELKKAKIRFVRINSDGALLVNDRTKDYNLNKIDYIDIIDLKRTANAKETGIFGHFTLFLKTENGKKRAVVGYVTYENDENIKVMFK